MALDVVSQSRCFGGIQFTYQHQSSETGTPMRFAAFVPPRADQRPVPVVWYLSGLTCTEENFTVKAGAQRIAAELGLMLIAPDTSPRGDAVPGDPAGSYDFGLGAGFYVDATQPPWSRNYRMASYVERELPGLISFELPADVARHPQAVHRHRIFAKPLCCCRGIHSKPSRPTGSSSASRSERKPILMRSDLDCAGRW